MVDQIVVCGAGQAGLQLCDSLRREGFEGRLILVGDETSPPYQRPPLSKEYLSGELGEERLAFRPAKFFEKNSIELVLGKRATQLDVENKQLHLGSEVLAYNKLGLTTGTRVRELPIEGGDLPGVHYLRTVEDARAIKQALDNSQHVVAIGGGFIGLEIAAMARLQGVDVTVIELQQRLMERVVSATISEYYEKLHRGNGVDLKLGVGVTSIHRVGQKLSITLDDDSSIDADAVVAGIGAIPNTELADQAGITCDNGIIVDEYARTSNEYIVAAGDCTMHKNQKLGVTHRLESVQNAVDQAKVAAATLMGNSKPYVQVPWFWSDQYDAKLQMVGSSRGYDQFAIRGSVEDGVFSVFYFKSGALVGVDSINQPREHMLSRKIMTNDIALNVEQAGDLDCDLKALTVA